MVIFGLNINKGGKTMPSDYYDENGQKWICMVGPEEIVNIVECDTYGSQNCYCRTNFRWDSDIKDYEGSGENGGDGYTFYISSEYVGVIKHENYKKEVYNERTDEYVYVYSHKETIIRRRKYWFEPEFPCIIMKINNSLKTSTNGWCKINSQLHKIDKIWTKVNGVLREV